MRDSVQAAIITFSFIAPPPKKEAPEILAMLLSPKSECCRYMPATQPSRLQCRQCPLTSTALANQRTQHTRTGIRTYEISVVLANFCTFPDRTLSYFFSSPGVMSSIHNLVGLWYRCRYIDTCKHTRKSRGRYCRVEE